MGSGIPGLCQNSRRSNRWLKIYFMECKQAAGLPAVGKEVLDFSRSDADVLLYRKASCREGQIGLDLPGKGITKYWNYALKRDARHSHVLGELSVSYGISGMEEHDTETRVGCS